MAGPDDDKLAEDWGLDLDDNGDAGGVVAATMMPWRPNGAAMIEGDNGEDDSGGPDRVLNQDEIDNLLGFDANAGSDVELTGVQALINSALVSYERLPMLEIVFDRLVRLTTDEPQKLHLGQCRSLARVDHLGAGSATISTPFRCRRSSASSRPRNGRISGF